MAEGDLDAVMRLAAATPEAPHWSRSIYEAFLDGAEAKRILVAEHPVGLAGFIVGQIVADSCELEAMVVAPQHRRAGVGRALLAALTAWASSRHTSKMQLEVRCQNDSAIAFYERAGFTRDGLRRAYYHDPEEDAVLMSRDSSRLLD